MPVVVSSSSPTPRSAANLASEVARSVGKERSDTAVAQALDYLNHIINELNTMQPWYMLRTVASDTALTANTADYTLSTDIHMIEKVQLADATTAAVVRTIPYFDYAEYKDFDPTMSVKTLAYWTTRNLFGDNKVTFYSTPAAADAAAYKFRISYVKRIPPLADIGDTPAIPREFEAVLLAGAKYYMRDMDESADSPKAAREFANYQRLLRRLQYMDKTQPDEKFRFRLRGTRTPFGTTYIRIP